MSLASAVSQRFDTVIQWTLGCTYIHTYLRTYICWLPGAVTTGVMRICAGSVPVCVYHVLCAHLIVSHDLCRFLYVAPYNILLYVCRPRVCMIVVTE